MEALKAISLSSQMDMLRQVLDQNIPPVEMLRRMTASYTRQDIEELLNEINYNIISSWCKRCIAGKKKYSDG
ncbi:TraB/GumN family protein [Chitinophaga pinensis]|uniref:TraB/GumN family protein n=1 Tax=Chitinophaga pinensis TaxID=79329 RepID=A0A5C6LYW7_9BACT|nr:TraB/GumN family protein [Chitinophaga pinensis]TWW00839.1 TraB/GumN family protein [Chitinophaga pinensis]